MMINGKKFPLGNILLGLLVVALIFPKTVFTLILLFFAVVAILGITLFYRFRSFFSLFKNAANFRENTSDRADPRNQDEKHSRVYECEDYEVIKEDNKKKPD